MNKKQLIMLAMAGVSALSVSQIQAQISYNNEDLLLNFRDISHLTDQNMEVDLGNVTTFTSATPSTPIIIDSGAWGAGVVSGFNGSMLTGTGAGTAGYGAPATANKIGFSADAADYAGGLGSQTLYMTSTIGTTSPGNTIPATGPDQSDQSGQLKIATAINNIGQQATPGNSAPYGNGTQLGSGPVSTVASSDTYSYQSQGQDPSIHTTIDFGGNFDGSPAPIETTETTANRYSGLWEVPVNGVGSDTYLGYFEDYTSGEITFTPEVSAVPEPSTYAMIAGAGLLALSLRRQFRTANA